MSAQNVKNQQLLNLYQIATREFTVHGLCVRILTVIGISGKAAVAINKQKFVQTKILETLKNVAKELMYVQFYQMRQGNDPHE